MKKYTYKNGTLAHRAGNYQGRESERCVELPDQFDLRADYDNPQTWPVYVTDGCGRRTGRKVRVKIDHEATGTDTTGTGDTQTVTV
jgi:hypothetical protein